MPEQSIIPPAYQEKSFHCPHCGVYARQYWFDAQYGEDKYSMKVMSGLDVCICEKCKDYSLWRNTSMIFPDKTFVDPASKDLPDSVKADYKEAGSILGKSPRGAAALLRLAIQKLCMHLGQPGKNLNEDIGELVKQGLPTKTQKALDIVRVTGSESVHPGTLDVNDNPEIARSLFKLVNFIAEKMITEPKEIDALYEVLPESKRKQIDERDSTAS